jgi:arylsulfatase A-like enzyme
LHTASFTPHTLFRAGIVTVLAAALAISTFSAQAAIAEPWKLERRRVLVLALPLLTFELLIYQWLQVYAIADVVSLASALASVGFVLAFAATIAVFVWMRPAAAARVVAAFSVLLAAAPLGGQMTLPGRGAAAQAPAGTGGAPRHVFLITVDTLRRDAVSAYGEGRLTPAIDRLAADSVVFDNAWSTAPWTLPALGSMMSGLAPAVHGVTGLTSRLSDRVTTLAETLSARGFRTAAIVHNPLLEPARNFGQGFVEYMDLHEPSYGGSLGAELLQTLGVGDVPPPTWPSTADLTERAVDWIESHREDNFFLWLHYFDPHAPYAPPSEQIEREAPPGHGLRFDDQTALGKGTLVPSRETREWIRELYDAEVRDVDANIGRLIETLRRIGVYDDALIVLTSDHGEEFWEHGRQGHGQSLHPELLRVPLLMKLPGMSSRRRVATDVSTTSIAPSILELCRIPVRRNDFSAPGLEALASGNLSPDPSPIVSGVVWTEGSFVDERLSIGFGDFRYISAALPGRDQLFDRSIDPDEQRSVAGTSSEALATAKGLLAEHARQSRELRTRLQIDASQLGLDDATLRRLRTLGYVQ